MEIYLVVNPNPCFDCSTEEVIAVCIDPQKAKDIASRFEAEIHYYDVKVKGYEIISNHYRSKFTERI